MRLRFLGSTSEAGACLSRYETDRRRIVVQGPEAADRGARAYLRHVPGGETAVEVPGDLRVEIARRAPSDRD